MTRDRPDSGHVQVIARDREDQKGPTMWMAADAAKTHIAVLVVGVFVLAGILGIITTHKGNNKRRRR